MRVFLTGGTGFIGGEVARRLRGRGDEVVALVRNPAKATALRELGCELVAGDVSDRVAIAAGLAAADAAIHNAAIYEVGIPESARPAMYETNVRGTENVLGAALEAGTPKVVYVSTVAAFGNTRGEIVDETHQHRGEYCSYYEETKHLAHQAARGLIDHGLPCVIVQPGGVYGPHDHSQLGNVMNQFLRWRLPLIPMAEMGHTAVHRDDVADGILLALDRGTPGEAYVLGGEMTTLGEMVATLAKITGRRPPIGRLPT
jgi:nucleoside-diphosphate-sugar epimerase